MTPRILTQRLALVSLPAAFLRASLEGRAAEAAALLPAYLPPTWPQGHEPLLRRRLAQLEADPTHQPWLLRAILLCSETSPHDRAPRAQKDTPEGEGGPALAKVRPLIGVIGFHTPPDSTGTVEVGYRVEPAYRRHGYATEAVRALFDWATHTYGIQRFRASISPRNEPSLRLIKKLGFHLTGHQHDQVDGLELVFECHAVTPRPYTSDEDTA